ncbi:HlyD family secretion protein [Chitinophagaceae bacterium LB-8]|uniref:HlyD family secretion protein n=1 Tax=Paraflavisolibacter caeni TaxID=2982496 RepID=A0A9X3B6S1_9BACT|nr:HlyD family secretion protein [Paraflavisolibacter caeni]MCU7547641.1 HlyD family secretion protein [Paraflavisolibacter caeni]
MESNNQKVHKSKRQLKPITFILPLILIIGGSFGYKKLMHSIHYESTDNAQLESNAVPVISRIAGYIDSVYVDDYQEIKAGQLLLVLDDKEYQIAVSQAEADLLQAEADLASARAAYVNVGAAEKVASANTDVLQTKLAKAQSDLTRDEALFADGSITRKQLDDSRSNVETARMQLIAGSEQIKQASVQGGTASALIQKAQATIATRKAALDQAKLRLSYTHIYAPSNGRVGKTNLERGQYIQPGQSLTTVVNNETFWLVANFKETQLKSLSIGQPVEITLDGYPDKKFNGKITSFSEATGAKFSLLPPDNASGNFVKVTQRVPVKIEFENSTDLKPILKAGLSAEVDVRVK